MSSDSALSHSGRYMGNATERLAYEQESTTPLIDVEAETQALKALAHRILDLPDGASPDASMIQEGLSGFAKLYTAQRQSGDRSPPFRADEQMPVTVAMTTMSAMVSQVNIELFELGMWRMWSDK